MATTWTKDQLSAIKTRDRSLLVCAAAGSGKTATLTERVIRSVLGDDDPTKKPLDISRILVVTFTRSAAAELKTRISSALSDAIAKNPQDQRLFRQLVDLGSAQISTIDSFYIDTVRQNFERLGLPASFIIGDESELTALAESLMSNAVDEYYERYNPKNLPSDDLQSYLESLPENEFAQLTDCLMNSRDENALLSVLLNLYRKMETYPEGYHMLEEYAKALDALTPDNFLDSPQGRFLAQYLKECFSDACAKLKGAIDYLRTEEIYRQKYLPSFQYDADYFEKALELLQSGSFPALCRHLKNYTATRLSPISKDKKTPEGDACAALRSSVADQRKKLVKAYFSTEEETLENDFRRTASYCRLLYYLFDKFANLSEKEKIRRGLFGFDDIRRYMYRLLVDGDGQPTDIAKNLQNRYDAVYIDEYQDVDRIQDAIFAAIGGDHRFMVGDIKQSIYGFRGTDPTVFADYRKSLPAYPGDKSAGCSVFMSENFRCNPPILDFTNAVCAPLFSCCPDSIHYLPEDNLVFAKKEDTISSLPVTIGLVFPEDEEEDPDGDPAAEEKEEIAKREELWIIQKIKELLHSQKDNGELFQFKDIAILCRSKDNLQNLCASLSSYGIPSTYAKDDSAARSDSMIFLMNLLEVLNNPQNDIPLSQLLQHPAFGFSNEEIVFLRTSDPELACHSLLESFLTPREDAPGNLSERCRDFSEWLENYRELSLNLSADKLIDKLMHDQRLSSFLDRKTSLYVYDSARRSQITFSSLSDFLPRFSQMLKSGKVSFTSEVSENAVNLMTVHGSKGLEFPAVFLCGTKKDFNLKDTRENILFSPRLGIGMKLFDADTNQLNDSLLRDIVAKEIRDFSLEEEMRILYVGLTRARERLFVSASFTSRDRFESYRNKIPEKEWLNRYTVLSQGQFLAWILDSIDLQTPPEYVRVEIGDSAKEPISKEDFLAPVFAQNALAGTDAPDELDHYRKTLSNRAKESAPADYLRFIPSRMSASKLSPGIMDDILLYGEVKENVIRCLNLAQPSPAPEALPLLLKGKGDPSAARYGTAMHEFMQFCPWEKGVPDSIEKEIDRLVRDKYILDETAELLKVEELQNFFCGRL